jgi:hypothetical protein
MTNECTVPADWSHRSHYNSMVDNTTYELLQYFTLGFMGFVLVLAFTILVYQVINCSRRQRELKDE